MSSSAFYQRALLLGLTALLAPLLGSCGDAPADATASAADQSARARSIPVETLRLQSQDFDERFFAAGVVEADEEVTISAEISGRIVQLQAQVGDRAEHGDLLLQLDDRSQQAQVAKLEAETDRAATELHWAQRELDRQERLFQTQVLAEQSRDDAQRLVETTRGDLAAKQAALEIARVELTRTRIESPLPGVIAQRYVSVGEYVTPGTRLYDLVAIDTVKFAFSVAERDIGALRPGQRLEVSIDAYDRGTFTGTVGAIAPAGSTATRTFRVELRIPNDASDRLRPGMAGRANVVRRRHENVLLVPESAILRDGQGSFVYLAEGDRARRSDIRILGQTGSMAVIEAPFEGELECIILGQAAVTDGAAINVRRRHDEAPQHTFN